MSPEDSTMNISMMIPMPKMPTAKKFKATRPCACGCGMGTKSVWASGHDGRATGWATRVMKGVMTLDEVPSNERAGAIIMLNRAGYEVPATIEPTMTEALIEALNDSISEDLVN